MTEEEKKGSRPERPEIDRQQVKAGSADFPGDKLGNILAMLKAHIEAEVYPDLDLNIIVTTSDKLWKHLNKYEEGHEKICEAKERIFIPLGFLISIVATLITASFHDMLGLPGETWQAIFFLGGALSFVYFCHGLWKLYSVQGEIGKIDKEVLIDKIMGPEDES